jgi:hypothetical protein
VGRTSVEVVDEDPTALGEAVVGEDPATLVAVVGEVPAVDLTVGEDPVVDLTTIDDATAVQAWRWSRSERTSGNEMIVVRVRVRGEWPYT